MSDKKRGRPVVRDSAASHEGVRVSKSEPEQSKKVLSLWIETETVDRLDAELEKLRADYPFAKFDRANYARIAVVEKLERDEKQRAKLLEEREQRAT